MNHYEISEVKIYDHIRALSSLGHLTFHIPLWYIMEYDGLRIVFSSVACTSFLYSQID